ncbi:hypothetical protein BH10PSE7_BH10PSE7_01190 [soil metagenome]
MTNPHRLRLAVFVVSAGLALWLFFALKGWLSIAAPIGVFMLGVIVGETLFQHFATQAQKIADLEDRVRNPPD